MSEVKKIATRESYGNALVEIGSFRCGSCSSNKD